VATPKRTWRQPRPTANFFRGAKEKPRKKGKEIAGGKKCCWEKITPVGHIGALGPAVGGGGGGVKDKEPGRGCVGETLQKSWAAELPEKKKTSTLSQGVEKGLFEGARTLATRKTSQGGGASTNIVQ